MSAACNEWRNSSSTAGNFVLCYFDSHLCISLPISKSFEFTADVPFFLVNIAPNSHATIKHLKDWEACQEDGHKVCLHAYACFFKLIRQFLWNVKLINVWDKLSKCTSPRFMFLKATIHSPGSYCLVFMTHVIFQKILVGLFATSFYLFIQDGI